MEQLKIGRLGSAPKLLQCLSGFLILICTNTEEKWLPDALTFVHTLIGDSFNVITLL